MSFPVTTTTSDLGLGHSSIQFLLISVLKEVNSPFIWSVTIFNPWLTTVDLMEKKSDVPMHSSESRNLEQQFVIHL